MNELLGFSCAWPNPRSSSTLLRFRIHANTARRRVGPVYGRRPRSKGDTNEATIEISERAPSSEANGNGSSPQPTPARKKERRNSNGASSATCKSEEKAPPSWPAPKKTQNSAPQKLPPKKMELDPHVYDMGWDACTVRGWEDGSLVFKFDQLDPKMEEEVVMEQAADFAWSNAVKLGVKFPQQLHITLKKLENIVEEFNGKELESRTALRHSLFKTYDRAMKKQEFLRSISDDSDGSGSSSDSSGDDNGATASSEADSNGAEETENGAMAANDGGESKNGAKKRRRRKKKEEEDAAVIEDSKDELAEMNGAQQQVENSEVAASNGTHATAAVVELSEKETEQATLKIDAPLDGDSKTAMAPAAEMPIAAISALLLYFTNLRDALLTLVELLLVKPVQLCASSVLSLAIKISKLPLVLYRLLPYNFRRLFQNVSWPPEVAEHHVSEAINNIFLCEDGFNKHSLGAAGFDSMGRCHMPLQNGCPDIPKWRLEQLIGRGIRDKDLYLTALRHPTALPPENRILSYERLEYLGDAVMELCTRELLMERAPGADEGELTGQGQMLVAGVTINKYGAWMGLDKWVLCNAYSMRDGLAASPHILGDAFEALLGAVYVDRGLEAARELLIRVLTKCPSVQIPELGASRDYKGMLLRVARLRKVSVLPKYYVVSAHPKLVKGTGVRKKYWKVNVDFNGAVIGSGGSFEKKEAERMAARSGLKLLGELMEDDDDDEEYEFGEDY